VLIALEIENKINEIPLNLFLNKYKPNLTAFRTPYLYRILGYVSIGFIVLGFRFWAARNCNRITPIKAEAKSNNNENTAAIPPA
jgi:hypothetical protein